MDTTEQNKCPLVSVLVPVYNVEAYIARCARSILVQTYSNLEFIFVDDGCTDSSIDILKVIIDESSRYKDKCTIIHHGQNKGLAAARNTAIANCHGEFVFHVDHSLYIFKIKLPSVSGANSSKGTYTRIMPSNVMNLEAFMKIIKSLHVWSIIPRKWFIWMRLFIIMTVQTQVLFVPIWTRALIFKNRV